MSTKRWLGISVSGDKVIAVDAKINSSGSVIIQSDQSWKLQSGDRNAAYAVMHQQVMDYVQNNGIKKVIVKASALVTGGSTKLAHLHAAELRGVVIAAAASHCTVITLAKALISRTFGNRKVDEYLKDDSFWSSKINGALRNGSREAAMLLLAAKDES
ncbi:hypothetical protein [Ferrovibrio sp.]|uniref:hypothetical protein n=1 Tax=Ferrovibrio sp. TaxID=1917215 RepID=UPI0035B19EC6